MNNSPRLILASASVSRRSMLENAGVAVECIPADINEDAFKDTASPDEIAAVLACEKALYVAATYRDALVIGADQVLECDGQLLSKAVTPQAALEKLKFLRGRTHRLISAVALVKGEEILWQFSDHADLTMYDLSDEQLNTYCVKAGAALTRSVGAYELESYGSWLFESVKGDFFTVLGLPLLPLLAELGKRGVTL